ncbi:uncharacterized protein LOC143084833 [Mytilus galloprovincialis]|uniref:uncharacterized protein LOC143084833 n=1 Tax=Mytilus galloprovincialis TaxID=29158 RepID=UPI003F7CADAA
MIKFISLMLIINEIESSLNGKCSEYDSLGKETWFCCNNHEDVNGTCIECANGFESLDGSPCRPCPRGFFGKECLNKCDCNILKCNHIKGCINSEQNWTVEKTESTPLTNATSTREYNDNWLTTQLSTIITVYTISQNQSTSITSTRRLQSTTPKPEANDLGLNNREIIIYSIGGGAFVFFILMCSVCKHRYKRIYGSVKRHNTGIGRRIDITDNPQREVPLEDMEGLYEEINESNMIDNMVNLKENNGSVTDSNGSYVQPDSNNYLTPYQPADEDAHINTSDDSKSESSASNNPPISDHESTSSKSDVIGERSSYLNPYQPIIHSADIHEYSSTHKIDDPGSSGSDKQTLESGYLNPYQPMVPDNDLHEYKSVLECSDKSDSTVSNACTNEMGVEFFPLNQDLKSETETYEYKSIKSKASDTVSKSLDKITDDSVQKFQSENDLSYVHME